MKNVYFSGKAGAGKTFACEYLKKTYGAIQAKFAFPVYGLAKDYFNMQGKDRHLLQYIGTDAGRDLIDTNIWVNRFKEDIRIVTHTAKVLYNKSLFFVSDDVRFPNEHEVLKSMGWVGIYLNVSDELRIKRLGKRDGDAQVGTLNHSSETSIDLFKNELIQVDASVSLDEMYKQIETILI